jgi:hypothetical protein
MTNKLDKIEAHLVRFIEGNLNKLVGVEIVPSEVAAQLAQAMDDGVRWNKEGKGFAPDKYALTCNPEDARILLENTSDFQNDLSIGLLEAARESDYLVFREPVVTIAADPTMARADFRVVSWHSTSPLEFTQGMPIEPKTNPGILPRGAYLIIDGTRHFPLERPTINIGRRLDNQLILEDALVSRTHAQIRARDSRYVIFDVGSSAGTRVNGRPVKQHVLQSGDVIDIAGIRLVYGEDPGGISDETPRYSHPFPPRPAGDQRTRTIKKGKDSEG